MAVLVEGISVIIKAGAIVERYPGGWGAFEANPANATLCADGELIRLGFMVPDDVKAFVDQLAQHGIVYQQDGQAVDVVVADQQRGFMTTCDWAECSYFRSPDGYRIVGCRMIGSTVKEVVMPDGWEYENSLSANHHFVENGWVSEFMDFKRHDNGLDVYEDLETGKELYVGRTKRRPTVEPIRLPEDKSPAKLEACRAYARMMNHLDFSHLEPWLDEDVKYTSQWVMDDIHGRDDYAKYIQGKLSAIRRSGKRVWAEIGYTEAFGAGPCVVLAQGTATDLAATLLVDLSGDKISSMTMCCVPSPHECRRTGEYP